MLGKGAEVRVIHMLRKPLSEGSITKNVLKHGTGAVNIEACRTPTSDNLNGGTYSEGGNLAGLPGDNRSGAAAGMYAEGGGRIPGQYKQPSGRWPANVVLQHLDGCKDSSCDTGCPVKVMGNNSRFYKHIGGNSNE